MRNEQNVRTINVSGIGNITVIVKESRDLEPGEATLKTEGFSLSQNNVTRDDTTLNIDCGSTPWSAFNRATPILRQVNNPTEGTVNAPMFGDIYVSGRRVEPNGGRPNLQTLYSNGVQETVTWEGDCQKVTRFRGKQPTPMTLVIVVHAAMSDLGRGTMVSTEEEGMYPNFKLPR